MDVNIAARLLKISVTFFILATSPSAAFSSTIDLFFSEYIEGSSFNKALEIYNPFGRSVGMDGYSIEIYSNGASSPSATIALTGVLDPGSVFVLAHTKATNAIFDKSTQTSSKLSFNGDDAIALTHEGDVLDIIGVIGDDPGTFWGNGNTTTQDHTLIRNADVLHGDPNGSDPFDPSVQWHSYDKDTFHELGAHSVSAVPLPSALLLMVSGLIGIGLIRALPKATPGTFRCTSATRHAFHPRIATPTRWCNTT